MEARDYMDLVELQLRIKEGVAEPCAEQGRKVHCGIPRHDLELALPSR